MSDTSTQIPTFVPEPDELLEPLGRGGEDVWARLKALRFDGAALLSRFIPGTGLREVKSWRKRPGAIDAATLEVLDALEHTLDVQRRGWNPVEGATLEATVGLLGEKQCTLKVLGEDVQFSMLDSNDGLETWSISNWTCVLMRQQLEVEGGTGQDATCRRCWLILPGEEVVTLGKISQPGLFGCGELTGELRVVEFYEGWWDVQERYNLAPSDATTFPGRSYFKS
jgi:hypothetical protein